MTKKHFIAIAGFFAQARPEGFNGDPKTAADQLWLRIMNDMIFFLWAENEDFDVDKFTDACYS